MKQNILLIILLILLMGCATKTSQNQLPAEETYLFLCLGQSNMEGHAAIEPEHTIAVDPRFMVLQAVDCPGTGRQMGNWYTAIPPLVRCNTGLSPTDYFGRTMAAQLPSHIKTGILNVSIGGCKIELFDKENYESYVETLPDWLKNMVNEYDGNPYQRLVDLANRAQTEGAIIKGILLHQGESNTGDKEWPNKVKTVYNNLLADLNLPPNSIPLLAGEVVNEDQEGVCASMNPIIQTLPQVIHNAHIISSAGCQAASDNIHFSAAGYRELGKRYANQMLTLLGTPQADTFRQTGNPLIKNKFTADPTPMVHAETLYLYVGHDEYYEGQDTASGGREFNITEWLCYSTTDMQTWTDHGSVLKPADYEWGIGEAWASQVIEKDGEFYFYNTVQAGEPYNSKIIGVSVADTPTGPFKDAIGKPLITDDMTPNGPRGWWNDIDPTVSIDDDGTPWMSWGNGTCFIVKLKPNMTELAGPIHTIDTPEFAEGPWLHKHNGLYYLTYASHLGTYSNEMIAYATAPSIEGPWTYRGVLTGAAENSFTIHPGIIEFKNQWYLFYHNAALTINGRPGAIGRRAVCVDYLYYNPDGTMVYVEQTKEGITVPPKNNKQIEQIINPYPEPEKQIGNIQPIENK